MMNIQFHTISNSVSTLAQESFFNSLSSLNKRVVIVAAVAFALLAVWAVYKYCMSGEIVNGKGKKVHPDGSLEEGDFINGKLNGDGRRVYQKDPRYVNGSIGTGKFQDGELHGIGKLVTHPAQGFYYEGEFVHGAMTGKGKYVSDGEEFEGDFVNGKLIKGTQKVRHGHNFIIFEGNFVDGSLEGQGKITYPDGTVHEGLYEKGDFKG